MNSGSTTNGSNTGAGSSSSGEGTQATRKAEAARAMHYVPGLQPPQGMRQQAEDGQGKALPDAETMLRNLFQMCTISGFNISEDLKRQMVQQCTVAPAHTQLHRAANRLQQVERKVETLKARRKSLDDQWVAYALDMRAHHETQVKTFTAEMAKVKEELEDSTQQLREAKQSVSALGENLKQGEDEEVADVRMGHDGYGSSDGSNEEERRQQHMRQQQHRQDLIDAAEKQEWQLRQDLIDTAAAAQRNRDEEQMNLLMRVAAGIKTPAGDSDDEFDDLPTFGSNLEELLCAGAEPAPAQEAVQIVARENQAVEEATDRELAAGLNAATQPFGRARRTKSERGAQPYESSSPSGSVFRKASPGLSRLDD